MGAVGAIQLAMGFAASINEPVLAAEDGVDHRVDHSEAHSANWYESCLSQWRRHPVIGVIGSTQ